MNHFLRLTVISVLVFLVMTAYCVMPKHGRNTVIASRALDGAGDVPGFQIFIECDGRALDPEAFQLAPDKKEPAEQEEGVNSKEPVDKKGRLPDPKVQDKGLSQTLENDDKQQQPEKEPVEKPPVKPEKKSTYKIKKGDTLLGIAKKLYGEERYVDAIVKANPGIKPTRLRIGRSLTLPKKPSQQQEDSQKKVPLKSYTIKAGDTFYSLAEEVLGDGKSWRKLWTLNRGTVKNYNRLPLGTEILLPAGTP